MSKAAGEKRRSDSERLLGWLDMNLGISHPLLRPVPQYAINPFYWLGALAVVAFVIQGVTGFIMMLYYVPTPADAYSSTLYVFNQAYYGRFLETVHLYTAYAMIMLAFMHMMRGYFVSVHKEPRQIMWVVGMLMGFVTLGFGFTGYLLPWTVVSKSATDVGVGMLAALPPPVSSFMNFLVVGAGGDAATLLRFYDLHVVILPAVLLVLLALKMYMLEVHGISEPVAGSADLKRRLIPIFPEVSLYLVGLAALFGSAMLFIAAVFPLHLPPQYSPELAAQYTPQPDWYFLWIYQILKISVFEGPGLPVALTIVTLLFVLLVALPFIDKGRTRRIAERRVFVTLGLVFVGELIALAYWGTITPGQIIPTEQAIVVLGAIALVIAAVSYGAYRLLGAATKLPTSSLFDIRMKKAQVKTSAAFVVLLTAGTLMIGDIIGNAVKLFVQGPNSAIVLSMGASLTGLGVVVLAVCYLLYRLDLASGSIKRRIPPFEIGWREE